MAAQNTFFKSIAAIFSSNGATRESARADANTLTAANVQDEEQQFLASIAHLDADERQQRIQKREMYRRMAQRQGIKDVESQQNQYYKG